MPKHLGLAIVLGILLALASSQRARGLELHKQYEEELIGWALSQTRLVAEPDPEGKIIERIVIVREDIIADSDPWPNFLNVFHVKTRDYIVRQELLVAPGQVWDQEKVDESARNLRALFILAVVRTVACKSARPGHVILLVVTKDLWSIRMNTIFSQTGTVLQNMDFTPTEENFLGRNKRISLHLKLQQLDWDGFVVRDALRVGQLYVDRRILGSRWRLEEWFDAIIAGDVPCAGALGVQEGIWCPDRGQGSLEGVFGQVRVQRPLYSLATPWAFEIAGAVSIRQFRRYRINSGSTQRRGERTGLSLWTDSFRDLPGQPAVPRIIDVEQWTVTGGATRSFGRTIKHNLSSGLTAYRNQYRHPESIVELFDRTTLDLHARYFLPRSEDAIYAFVAYHTFSPRYVRLRNIQSFALSEDFVLGHNLSAESRFAANTSDISQSFISLLLSASYRWYFWDNMLTAAMSARGRLQPNLDDMGYRELGFRGSWANTLVTLGAKNVSPRLWIGRLHLALGAQLRYDDLDQGRTSLGGDSGLRGYTSGQFEGDHLFQINAEYRSLPINLFTLHLGFVLFYDGGAVFGGPDPLDLRRELPFRYHHSVGLGIRGHFPQFDKESLRIDFALPLSDARPQSPFDWFSLSFMQVF